MSGWGLCECGGDLELIRTPQFKHYGKIVCIKCGKFIKWEPNPNKDDRRETTKQKVMKDYCELCLRKHAQLGVKESLEVHHIIPLTDGGKDELDNILVACTACHREIHWLQLYLNKHLLEVSE